MNFASDNFYGVHPAILKAIGDANGGTAPSYGVDDYTKAAEDELGRVFDCDLRAFLVTSGTAANGLALSSLTPGYGAILCESEAHISADECNSPELFTGGAKMMGLDGKSGKISAAMVETALKGFVRGEHGPKPRGVSITNASELGTVYSPDEAKAISDLIRPRGMKLHMDGARFANALAELGCTPAELTWKSGVDVMSFGATKNGAMMLEAVVFFDPALAEDFAFRRMRGGQLMSKGRYLGAQMLAYLKDGLWLENARTANALAQKFAAELETIRSVRLAAPVQANIVFAIMPRRLYDALRAKGAVFGERPSIEFGPTLATDEVFVRFVASCLTPQADVERFIAMARASA